MYSYQKTEPGVWSVGSFLQDGSWEPESQWGTADEAAEHSHLLNGICGLQQAQEDFKSGF